MLRARDAEQAAIAGVVASARQGRGGALLLCGEPGIGKSALLDYAAERGPDMLALRCSAAEAEATLAYASLHQLLRPILGRLSRLPEPQARALRVALGLEPGPGADRFLISLATLTLLSEMASERPVLCLLDDVHWADPPSLEVVAFLARRLASDPVALLMAGRDCSDQGWATGVTRLGLSGIGPGASVALLEERWGASLAPSARDALARATGGNPLALRELPRVLTPEERSGRRPLPDPLPIAAGLERVFAERARSLRPELRRLALLCAADGSGSVAAITRAARGLGVDDPVRGLPELGDLLRFQGPSVAFRHPLMRSAIYHGSDPLERRAAHRALADALAAEEGEADRRAWHRALAAVGPDEEVALALERTADRAVRRSGHGSAAVALERAAELSPTDQGRARRLVAAADTAWRGGDALRARALLEGAERMGSGQRAVWLRARYLQGLVELRSGIPADGLAILLEAATEAVSTAPSLGVRMLIAANEAGFEVGDPESGRRLHGLMADVPEPEDPRDALVRRLYLAVNPRTRGESPAQVREDLAWVEGLDDPDLLTLVGGMAFGLGEDAIARRLRSKAAARARLLGAGGLLAWTLRGQTTDETVRGRFAWAEACAAEGLQLALETGQPNLAVRHRTALAEVAALRGQAHEGRRLAEAALTEASGRGLRGTAANVSRVLGQLALAQGEFQEAVTRLEGLWRMGLGVRGVAVLVIPDMVEAAVRVGHPEAASELLPALLAWAQAGSGEARALAARSRALLAAGAEADRLFHEALAAHELVERPLDAARTALLYGEHLRRERRRTDAREQLRRALEAFERLGSGLWADRARRELRATGETARKRVAATLDLLTRQELQVVRVVSQGATNREAAAQLFISPRTVDHHLRNVFQKLGIRSRAELVRVALAGHGVDAGPA